MNIKRLALLVIVAVTFLSLGIYSQTPPRPPAPAPPPQTRPTLNIPPTTYSGENLGFTVTPSNNGRIEVFFVIKVNGKWVPLPTGTEPSVKKLDLR